MGEFSVARGLTGSAPVGLADAFCQLGGSAAHRLGDTLGSLLGLWPVIGLL